MWQAAVGEGYFDRLKIIALYVKGVQINFGMKNYDVFISYRRKEGQGLEIARIIDEAIDRTWWYRSFLDYNELKDNAWDPQIFSAIESAPVFLFILTEGSLNRCVDKDDCVRKEIQYAIAHQKHIVPVNLEGKVKWNDLAEDVRDKIPEDIRHALFDQQQSEIALGQLFKQSISKLIKERIKPYVTRVIVLKRVVRLILSVVFAGVLLLCIESFKHKAELERDCDQYSQYLGDAEMIVKNDPYAVQAITFVNKADSIYLKYKESINKYRFDSERLKKLRESLYDIHYERLRDSYKCFVNDISYKEIALENLNSVKMFNRSDNNVNFIERNLNK